MYGKHFASTYKGSMFGAGIEVFAVWGYVIANTVDSQVELNPHYLAAVLGSTPDVIEKAINFLASPDEHSRSKNDEGRRIVREGEFAYRVPNHETYRAIRCEDDRRAYNRQKKAEERARKKENVNTRVIDSQRKSAHTEAEAETKEEKNGSNEPKPRTVKLTDEAYLLELKAEQCYDHINIDDEYGKAQRWIAKRPKRRFTRRFFEGWLNNIERPLSVEIHAKPKELSPQEIMQQDDLARRVKRAYGQ